jgi:hypothetical protein
MRTAATWFEIIRPRRRRIVRRGQAFGANVAVLRSTCRNPNGKVRIKPRKRRNFGARREI